MTEPYKFGDDRLPPPAPPTDKSKKFLSEALALVKEAQGLLAAVWQEDRGVRTPYAAEAVSLLDRARGKLEKAAAGKTTSGTTLMGAMAARKLNQKPPEVR